jgi:uncharacterized membrane protein
MMIIDVTLARALHVLAVLHWIGGVTFVTLVMLPALTKHVAPAQRLDLFEALEHRFGHQARLSTLLAGLSGFYMTWRLDAWSRFLDASYWWMHAMLTVWVIFTVVLFVAEPLFLHRWFRAKALREPDASFLLLRRFHAVALVVSLITTGGAIIGAHGGLFW